MSKLVVSVPTERLERDVLALLSDEEREGIELIRWDMSQPTPRDRIDIVVPPYMSATKILPMLAGVQTRLVQSQSIGYDGVADVLPAGTVFANAATVHEAATAELAIALALAAQRRIPEYVRNQQETLWKPRFSPSLADRRVLVLGYGGVGKAVVDRLEPFETDVTIVASTARDEGERRVHALDELPVLLPEAEIVILTLPANDATRHVIDDAALSALPDGALIVNVGRGPLVDTDALVDHAHRGRIRAALDVTDPEPLPADHPLWNAPDVLIVPHVGGNASSMQPRIARLVVRQIRLMADDEDPANVVLRT